MSWRVVVYGLAGVVVFDIAMVIGFLVAVDVKTRSDRRNQDRPIPHDDTWTRFERSKEWTNEGEGR